MTANKIRHKLISKSEMPLWHDVPLIVSNVCRTKKNDWRKGTLFGTKRHQLDYRHIETHSFFHFVVISREWEYWINFRNDRRFFLKPSATTQLHEYSSSQQWTDYQISSSLHCSSVCIIHTISIEIAKRHDILFSKSFNKKQSAINKRHSFVLMMIWMSTIWIFIAWKIGCEMNNGCLVTKFEGIIAPVIDGIARNAQQRL